MRRTNRVQLATGEWTATTQFRRGYVADWMGPPILEFQATKTCPTISGTRQRTTLERPMPSNAGLSCEHVLTPNAKLQVPDTKVGRTTNMK